MFNFVAAYESVGVSLLCGMVLGIFGILLFTCMPKFMTYTSIILGSLCCVAMAVILFISMLASPGYIYKKYRFYAVYQTFIYIFIVVLILVALVLFVGMCCHRNEINLSVQYLE